MRIFNQLFTCLLTLAVITCLATSCKDDSNIFAEIELPDGASSSEVMTLERWSYEVPFQVKSDSEWIIETTGDCCYATPKEGSGSATVQICVLDNNTEERVNGELRVIFPKDPSRNITLKVQQKSAADYDDNANVLNTGNRIYAVGYGYDISGEYASPNSITKPIVQFKSLNDDKLITFGPVSASFKAKTYSGSSVTELSNELNTAANFGGDYFGFSGEIGASFSMSDFSNNNNEYAISYVDVALKSAHLETDVVDLRENYMTPSAYRAINGVDSKGEPSSNYPSSNAGFKALINSYGTHLVMNAKLGGRMKYAMTVDISNIEGAYDLTAFINASYKNNIVQTSTAVSDAYKESYQKNSAACTTSIQVLGGGTKEALALNNKEGEGTKDTQSNVEAWSASLQDGQNLALVGFDTEESLIPLYELVDKAKYPERYAAFKAYMTGTDFKNDIDMEYDCGTASHISTPSFTEKGTLVKDVYSTGRWVARFCEEYIPVINKQKRVVVAYPVISNKVKTNMGYFIGDENHKPAKVCWDGNSVTVTEYANESKGAKKELYVRGSSFSTTSFDDITKGRIEDYLITASGVNGGTYKYPVVKILKNYWMKENYKGTRSREGRLFGNSSNEEAIYYSQFDQFYYCSSMVNTQRNPFAPEGWRVANENDFFEIKGVLEANGVVPTGAAFGTKGVLGFGNTSSGMYGSSGLTRHGLGYYGLYRPNNPIEVPLMVIGDNSAIYSTKKANWDGGLGAKTGVSIRLIKE